MASTYPQRSPARKGLLLGDLLLHDHERLEKLLDQLLLAFDADASAEVMRLWTALDSGLTEHFELEERRLFPEFAKVDPVEVSALRAEHDALKKLLLSLGIGVDLHSTRLEVALEFVRELKAHAAREEALLYRWAEHHLDVRSRAWLRARLLALASAHGR